MGPSPPAITGRQGGRGERKKRNILSSRITHILPQCRNPSCRTALCASNPSCPDLLLEGNPACSQSSLYPSIGIIRLGVVTGRADRCGGGRGVWRGGVQGPQGRRAAGGLVERVGQQSFAILDKGAGHQKQISTSGMLAQAHTHRKQEEDERGDRWRARKWRRGQMVQKRRRE
jgi:hypothetical protein